MCWYAAVAQTGLGMLGTLTGQQSAEATAIAQRNSIIQNFNYSMQTSEIERQDAFDASVREIEKIRLNALSLNSGVKAAVSEGLEGGGRTANLLNRSVEGDEARAVTSTQENYYRKSNEIDLNKEANLISAKSQVNSIKAPDRSSMWLTMLGQGIAGYTSFMNAKTEALTKGADFGWKGAELKKKSNGTTSPQYVLGMIPNKKG